MAGARRCLASSSGPSRRPPHYLGTAGRRCCPGTRVPGSSRQQLRTSLLRRGTRQEADRIHSSICRCSTACPSHTPLQKSGTVWVPSKATDWCSAPARPCNKALRMGRKSSPACHGSPRSILASARKLRRSCHMAAPRCTATRSNRRSRTAKRPVANCRHHR